MALFKYDSAGKLQFSRVLGAALRYKRHGTYHDLSWSEYRRQADEAAAGLIGLGIERRHAQFQKGTVGSGEPSERQLNVPLRQGGASDQKGQNTG